MNPKDEITPEEKLLHLIRRSNKKFPKDKEKSAQQSASQKESLPSKPASVSTTSVSSRPQETKIILAGIKSINFSLINRLIMLLVFIILILFLSSLYFTPQGEISKPLSSLTLKPEKILLKQKEAKPFSYYQQEISQRNLFKSDISEVNKPEKVVPTGPTFKELIKDLNLLGIVAGDKPQVIIEDRRLNKTYFLYQGDYLGEIKVEDINSERVILEFKGEKVSIFL